jgi:thiol-disulfide isomerase/thioredoxin
MRTLIIILALIANLTAGVVEGDKAIGFSLKELSGSKSYTMDDFKGEVVLLNLWASWCSGCKEEMPEFYKLQKQYPKGFKIVAVSIDSDAQKSRDFLSSVEEELGMRRPFIVLLDSEKKLPKSYRCIGMPSSYLIDKEGVIRKIIVGSLDSEDIDALRHDIDALR